MECNVVIAGEAGQGAFSVELENPLADRYEALKTADLWGDKIPIGVIYRNEAAECRRGKEIFRVAATPEDIACQIDMKCVMMR